MPIAVSKDKYRCIRWWWPRTILISVILFVNFSKCESWHLYNQVDIPYCIVTLTQWIRYTIILIDIFSTAKIKLHVYIDSFKNKLCYYARQCCCRIQPLLSQKACVCVTSTSTPASSYIGNRGDYFREMFEVV